MRDKQNVTLFSIVLIVILAVSAIVIANNLNDDTSAQAIFGGQGVRVYQAPDDSSLLLGMMAQATVEITDISNDNQWIQVPFGDGFGWVDINAVRIQGTLE